MVISNPIPLTVAATILCPPWPASGSFLQILELLQPRACPSWLPDTGKCSSTCGLPPTLSFFTYFSPSHLIIINNYNNSLQIYKALFCTSLNFIFMTSRCGAMLCQFVSDIVAHTCNASSWEIKGT